MCPIWCMSQLLIFFLCQWRKYFIFLYLNYITQIHLFSFHVCLMFVDNFSSLWILFLHSILNILALRSLTVCSMKNNFIYIEFTYHKFSSGSRFFPLGLFVESLGVPCIRGFCYFYFFLSPFPYCLTLPI